MKENGGKKGVKKEKKKEKTEKENRDEDEKRKRRRRRKRIRREGKIEKVIKKKKHLRSENSSLRYAT